MPIYEYDCEPCGHRFERLVLSAKTAAETAVCPSCGSDRVHRLLSAFGLGSESISQQNLKQARKVAKDVQRQQDIAHREVIAHHGD
jgi:putative FmdB family regulatory protein